MAETKPQIKHFVRIANTDLEGNKSIGNALTKIKGISFMFSNLVCKLAGIDQKKKSGLLSEDETKKLEGVVLDPVKHGAPKWMLNRKFDPEDGKDRHLITANLKYIQENDVKFMKKMKSYRGMRHAVGLPVRGQRTKSNFRRSKGKVMGVKRKSQGKK